MNQVSAPDVWLANVNGVTLRSLNTHTHLSYTRVVNEVGQLTIVMPETISPDLLERDCQISVWRKVIDPVSGTEKRYLDTETIWLIRKWTWKLDSGGRQTTEIVAKSLNDLLRRRIIAYRYGASQARYANTPLPVDDIMKNFVLYNLGSGATQATFGATTGRALPNFVIQPNYSLGPTTQKTISWKPLLFVLKELFEASDQKGTPVFFDIVVNSAGQFEFRKIGRAHV